MKNIGIIEFGWQNGELKYYQMILSIISEMLINKTPIGERVDGVFGWKRVY